MPEDFTTESRVSPEWFAAAAQVVDGLAEFVASARRISLVIESVSGKRAEVVLVEAAKPDPS